MPNDVVRKTVELGRQKGFVTFELNELWLSTTTAPEDVEPEHIEAVMAALSEEGISVVEDEGP